MYYAEDRDMSKHMAAIVIDQASDLLINSKNPAERAMGAATLATIINGIAEHVRTVEADYITVHNNLINKYISDRAAVAPRDTIVVPTISDAEIRAELRKNSASAASLEIRDSICAIDWHAVLDSQEYGNVPRAITEGPQINTRMATDALVLIANPMVTEFTKSDLASIPDSRPKAALTAWSNICDLYRNWDTQKDMVATAPSFHENITLLRSAYSTSNACVLAKHEHSEISLPIMRASEALYQQTFTSAVLTAQAIQADPASAQKLTQDDLTIIKYVLDRHNAHLAAKAAQAADDDDDDDDDFAPVSGKDNKHDRGQ